MKVAALDLGSNTSLMLIAEVRNDKIERVYRDEIQITRLGQGVNQTKALHPDALVRAESCFKKFKDIIDEEQPEVILAMATSAARDASNGEEFFKLGKKYGIPIEIIPGEMEAELTYNGTTFDYPEKDGLCVIDVGGGSTEIIGCRKGKVSGVSVDVGSVRLTEMFISNYPSSTEEIEKLTDYVEAQFKKIKSKLPKSADKELLAVAGTPTTMAAVIQSKPYNEKLVHNFVIKKSQLEAWRNRMARMELSEIQSLVGMDRERADVITAGTSILLAGMDVLDVEQLKVSTRGVRYGVAIYAAKK